MLVLTRRENEKILFPSLGISVEVVNLSTKRAQLGIDAPREIRVIREELSAVVNEGPAIANFAPDEFQEDLDAASLAIHLAQNQFRQGMGERADEALDHALASLKVIEEKLSFNAENEMCFVRETAPQYRQSSSGMEAMLENWRCELVSRCY